MTARVGPRSPWLQTLLLVTLGVGTGFAFRLVTSADFSALWEKPAVASEDDLRSGAALAEPKRITFDDFMGRLFGQDDVFVLDARDAPTYEMGHVPGSLNLDAGRLSSDPAMVDRVLAGVPRDGRLVVYCSGGDCDLSMRLARLLVERGYGSVFVYEGGWTDWVDQGGPAEQGAPAQRGS